MEKRLEQIKDVVEREIARLADVETEYMQGKRAAYQEMLEMLNGNMTGNSNYDKVIGRG